MNNPYLNETIYFVLLLELAGIVLCPIGIFIAKLWIERKNKYKNQMKSQLIKQFKDIILNRQEIKVGKTYTPEILIETIEYIDSRFVDEHWNKAKHSLFSEILLPYARRHYKSSSWKKRHLAARTFLLFPLPADVEFFLKLLYDRTFYIRIISAKCLISLKCREALEQVLKKMVTETKNMKFFYIETIRNGGEQVIQDLMNLYHDTEDTMLKLVCLEVISDRTHPRMVELIQKDVKTQDSLLRLLIAKILTKHPNHNSMKALLNYISDPDPRVRAICCEGLSEYHNQEVLKAMNTLLADPGWNVRLQAALALRKLGKPGRAILEHQDWDIDKNAYEAARYVLTLP